MMILGYEIAPELAGAIMMLDGMIATEGVVCPR
jgi:hypothetical protein